MRMLRSITISKNYWLCQIGGWGSLFLVMFILNLQMMGKLHIIGNLLITCLSGLLATHMLRTTICRFGWLNLPPKKSLPRLSLAIILTSVIAGLVKILGIDLLIRIIEAPAFFLRPRFFFGQFIELAPVIISWTLIYCFHNCIAKTRKETLEKRRLEIRLREMEQQATASSEVNVDYLVDSLHRIQSSIEENPARSRSEITEFSQLLRRGFLTPE